MNLSFAPHQLIRMTSAQLRSAFGLPTCIDPDPEQESTTRALDCSARASTFRVRRGQKHR